MPNVIEVKSIRFSAVFCYDLHINCIDYWRARHGIMFGGIVEDEDAFSDESDALAHPKIGPMHRANATDDTPHRRYRGKARTMRSWRNGNAIGGATCPKKAARSILNRRSPCDVTSKSIPIQFYS